MLRRHGTLFVLRKRVSMPVLRSRVQLSMTVAPAFPALKKATRYRNEGV